QLHALLSRQRLRERRAGHRALLDEDLAQQPAGLPLHHQRALELARSEKLVVDEDLSELTPGKVGSIHRSSYRRARPRAKRFSILDSVATMSGPLGGRSRSSPARAAEAARASRSCSASGEPPST